MRGDVAAIHEQSGIRHLDEIVGAAAEEYVNPRADVGREKCAPRRLPRRVFGGRFCRHGLRINEAGLDGVLPFSPELATPVVFKRGGVRAVEVERGLARAAGREPFDDDGAAGFRAVPFAEGFAEFRADGLVVRRDGDERVLSLEHRLVALRPHEDGADDDREHGGEQGEIFSHALFRRRQHDDIRGVRAREQPAVIVSENEFRIQLENLQRPLARRESVLRHLAEIDALED